MAEKTYLCPLCQNVLTKDKWIKIIGEWDDQQKAINIAKKKLAEAEKDKEDREKKFKIQIKKAEREAMLNGMKKGIEKEKSEREKMVKMMQEHAKEMEERNKMIAKLQKQLAERKTPQSEGFDYEKEVYSMLCDSFPNDEIKPTGKKGDNVQYVRIGDKTIGSILYECKKTSKYSDAYITEVKRHMEIERATYAVLITHTFKDGKEGFFIDKGVVVVNPFAVLDVAFLLRDTIMQMHQLKVTRDQIGEKSRAILRYMQSGEFRANMVETIEKSERAYELMKREIDTHQKDWKERFKIYSTIHANIQSVRFEIGKIITGALPEIKHLPELTIN